MTELTTLTTPLVKAAGIGRQPAALLLGELGHSTVGDLLFHVPRRYVRRGELTEISALRIGEDVTILADVISVSHRRMRDRPEWLVAVIVGDASGGQLSLTFFAKNEKTAQWRLAQLKSGKRGLFAGTVGEFNGKRQLTHPQYELLGGQGDSTTVEEFAGGLIPVYPATRKLVSWRIAGLVRVALDTLTPPVDHMPASLRETHGLIDLNTAINEIHRPTSLERVELALRRLRWDEALAVQLTLVQRRIQARATPALPRPRRRGGLLDEFEASLPYELTKGQLEVGAQIDADLAADAPMHRLLQGEVGSGKTVCAVRAMLQVVDAGGQAALIAPTEVLAVQHLRSIAALLGPLGRAGELDGAPDATRVCLITGGQGAAARRHALAEAADGSAGIVIGTHALFYDGVSFANLGLVVVDEQHRFGVVQRDSLRAKADAPPHVLVMTATPIPRTVAMTVFGDLDISTLTELPLGRAGIATHVVPILEKPAFLDRAWRRIREEVARGHQVYVVCPRIGGDAASDDAAGDDAAGDGVDSGRAGDGGRSARRAPLAVLEVAPELIAGPLVGLRVGLLHGRLPTAEKESIMRDFASGRLDVLIATTVVEVGVDVPNATVMMILDADRFGVSQLHQLRGRVGRGSAPGLCLLVTEAHPASGARERLAAVASTLDGFELAELDLQQRREGDVLGEAQSGSTSHLRLLSLRSDEALIGQARLAAVELLRADPGLVRHPELAAALAFVVDEQRADFLEKG